jgi:TIR domain
LTTIILSYRREDTELMVGRICDRLREHFGRDSVMMDIDSIPYGLDFRKHIKETFKRCDMMLAVIGPRWAGVNEEGQTRLADETDWIRIEIEAALTKDVPVIPVLVNGAPMPKPKDLPESMRDLAFRQAAPLDMRRDFHAHMDRLIGVMDELLGLKAEGERAAVEPSPADTGRGQRHAANVMPPQEPPKVAGISKRVESPKAKVSSESNIPPRSPHPPAGVPVDERLASADRPLLLRVVAPDAAQRDAQSAILASNWWMVALRGVLAVAIGLFWFAADKGYFNSMDPSQQSLVQIYMASMLIFLLLDGALAVGSGGRWGRLGEPVLLLICSGLAELFLGGWVAMQRFGLVRAAQAAQPPASTTETVPAATAEPATTAVLAWPPSEFWVDIGIGFMVVGALLLAASPGLSARYGRVWLIAAGIAWVASGVFVYLSSTGDYAWWGDLFTIASGVAMFALALQLQARDKEQAGGA